jgi:hypothetical protein
MSLVYKERISFNVHLHCQMSVKTSKCLFLQTFDREFEVYKTEMQIYGQMTVNHLFIIQATMVVVCRWPFSEVDGNTGLTVVSNSKKTQQFASFCQIKFDLAQILVKW